LQPMQIGIGQIAEVDPARGHQVLLDRPNPIVAVLDVVETFDRLAKPPPGAGRDGALQRATVARRDQIPIGVGWAVELAIAKWRPPRTGRGLAYETGAQVRQILKGRGKQPGTKPLFATGDLCAGAPPDERPA